MKKCNRCQKDKEDDDFGWKSKARGIRQFYCKLCQYEYQADWYRRNSEVHKANATKNSKRYQGQNRRQAFEYLLMHPCVDCGEADPLVLEFDHLGDKESTVSEMIRNRATWEAIESEIKKCVIRCANCHRRRTATQLGWAKASFVFAPVARLEKAEVF